MLAYYRCSCFDAPRRRWMRPAAAVLCLAITLSTMLLKQHSVIDVVCGIVLAVAVDRVASAVSAELARRPAALPAEQPRAALERE